MFFITYRCKNTIFLHDTKEKRINSEKSLKKFWRFKKMSVYLQSQSKRNTKVSRTCGCGEMVDTLL